MACYWPIQIKLDRVVRPGRGFWTTVGCGKCLGCRADQARDWSVRIMHETQMHKASWFTTLTYSDEEVPENGSLCPAHFRKFVKTLRRQSPEVSVSYYACGEYGTHTQRPHYHAVLFGPHFLDKRFLRSGSVGDIWRSSSLETAWPHGFSELGTVTRASAAYVAGYVRKKVWRKVFGNYEENRLDPETGELVPVQEEFSRMSLRPAIGKRWIEKYWQDVYPRDCVVVEGKELPPPRYYDKWLEENQPEVFLEVKEKRFENEKPVVERELENREVTHQARSELFEKRNTL